MADNTETSEREIREQLDEMTSPEQKQWQEELGKRATECKPLGPKEWPYYVIILLGAFMALCNFTLFYVVIGNAGEMGAFSKQFGIFVGCAAVLLEATAVWFKLN